MENKREPRWQKWRLIPEVKVWQAVALSLNIEPDNIQTDRYAWMGAGHPFVEGVEFNDRLEVLLANLSNKTFFPTPSFLNMGGGYLCGVHLNEFSSWALSVAEWDIPDELKSIAAKVAPTTQASAPVTTKPKAGQTNKQRTNTLDPVIDKAIKQAGNRELAQVFLKLKELALGGELPFTGIIEGDALCYTDDNNQPAKLSKEALRKRLDRAAVS